MIACMTERSMIEPCDGDNVQASDVGWEHFSSPSYERKDAMLKVVRTWIQMNMYTHPEILEQQMHVPGVGNIPSREILGLE